jgi:hypothetical protein
MCDKDFAIGSNPEVHPSENAGIICIPLMTCAGLRNMKANRSVDLANPIFGKCPW